MFNELYPDATFAGLVRDPRAICERHIRRNYYTLNQIATYCSKAMDEMINYSKKMSIFHRIKYEDIIANPKKLLSEVYKICDLSLSDIEYIRMETKKVIGYDNPPSGKQLVWYEKADFGNHIINDAIQRQIMNLTEDQIITV